MESEHGPSDAGERGEKRRTTKKSRATKESYKKFYEDKIAKLEKETVEIKSTVFAGVRVYVEGYTSLVSVLTLKKMVICNGGKVCSSFSRKKTTHMICTALSGIKTDKFLKRHRAANIIHFVHPNWVIQSCKAGKLLPEISFSILTKSGETLDNFFAPKQNTENENNNNNNNNNNINTNLDNNDIADTKTNTNNNNNAIIYNSNIYTKLFGKYTDNNIQNNNKISDMNENICNQNNLTPNENTLANNINIPNKTNNQTYLKLLENNYVTNNISKNNSIPDNTCNNSNIPKNNISNNDKNTIQNNKHNNDNTKNITPTNIKKLHDNKRISSCTPKITSDNSNTALPLRTLPPLPTKPQGAPFQPMDIFTNLKHNKGLSSFPKAHTVHTGT